VMHDDSPVMGGVNIELDPIGVQHNCTPKGSS
jgi:hypothetical protein